MEEKRKIRELRSKVDTEYALMYAIEKAYVDSNDRNEMRDNLFYVAYQLLGEIKRITDDM